MKLSIDEQKARSILNMIAKYCGYCCCELTRFLKLLQFIDGEDDDVDEDNAYTYIYYDKDKKMLYGNNYIDALEKLLALLEKDDVFFYTTLNQEYGNRKKFSRNDLELLRFDMALIGVDVAELFHKKSNV